MTIQVTIDGRTMEAEADPALIDLLLQKARKVSRVGHHPQPDLIETGDSCRVEVDDYLVEPCAMASDVDCELNSQNHI
jgi:predicted molibdopterin-dependent oxidoreductase YjgC